jgi:hypothetical protein
MSNTSSAIYNIAVSKGLLSGLAAGFNEDFRKFKRVYRDQYKPARQMINIRRNHKGEAEAGGFFRSLDCYKDYYKNIYIAIISHLVPLLVPTIPAHAEKPHNPL